jgi:hypothetical protein
LIKLSVQHCVLNILAMAETTMFRWLSTDIAMLRLVITTFLQVNFMLAELLEQLCTPFPYHTQQEMPSGSCFGEKQNDLSID